MGAQNTARVIAGRLLEVRAEAGYRTAAQVDALFDEIDRELRPLGKTKHVTVVDWTHCPVMSPEAAAQIVKRIGQQNGVTERSAALASNDSPIAVLQFLRVIRDAGLSDRKLFFNASELTTWLSEVLQPAELARLNAFLLGAAGR